MISQLFVDFHGDHLRSIRLNPGTAHPLAILQQLRGVVDIIKDNAAHLIQMIMWVPSHGEIALFYAGDLLYFVCERRQRFQPK